MGGGVGERSLCLVLGIWEGLPQFPTKVKVGSGLVLPNVLAPQTLKRGIAGLFDGDAAKSTPSFDQSQNYSSFLVSLEKWHDLNHSKHRVDMAKVRDSQTF